MIHKLQVIFEREIAVRAVKAGAAASLPGRGTGGYEGGFADVRADVQTLGAGFGVFGIRRG